MKTLGTIRHSRESQKGNAIFIVFIGVIMFAALSFAVANMMNGGGAEKIAEQRTPLIVDGILDYAGILRQGVHDLRINGCKDMDISFENASLAGYAHTPAARGNCMLFGTAGGGILTPPPADWLENDEANAPLYGQWFFPANVCVSGIGTAPAGAVCDTDGTDNESLVAVLPYVKKDVCRSLNERLGLGSTIPSDIGNAWSVDDTLFTGVQADEAAINQDGVMAGCFEGAGYPAAGTYHFFQVLSAR